MGIQYHSVRTTVTIKMMLPYITFGLVLMNHGASAEPKPYKQPGYNAHVIAPNQRFQCCPYWYQRPPFCSFLGLMEPWGPMKSWEPCVDGRRVPRGYPRGYVGGYSGGSQYQNYQPTNQRGYQYQSYQPTSQKQYYQQQDYQQQDYQQQDYQQQDYQQQNNQQQDYSQDYFFGSSLIKMFIPKDISGALDKLGGVLPGIKKGKAGIINFHHSIMPILGEGPAVVKSLVPSIKPFHQAILRGRRPSDSDALKLRNAISDRAGPMLRKLGTVLKKELPTMRALAGGSVEEIMGQLSIIPDGEIKNLVRKILTWAKSYIGSLVEIIS